MAINLHVSKLMTIKTFDEWTPAFEVSGGSADPALLL